MFTERLKEARKKIGLSQKALALSLHISQQAYAKYELGTSSPNPETLGEICRILNISVDYLLGLPSTNLPQNLFSVSPIALPILGEISCGIPKLALETAELFTGYVPSDGPQLDFCLRAKGDSMTGAGIHEGDYVFIRKQEQVENGEIAAVIIEDEATLKRVYYDRENDEISLYPENPSYRPMHYRKEELNNIQILGKAVSVYSDLHRN